MRIDNRKVIGQITNEPEDTIRTWMIAVYGQDAFWFAGVDDTANPNLIEQPARVAGDRIKATVTAFDPVRFTIMLIEMSGNVKVLPMPAYTFNPGITKLSVDIGEIMAGHILEIALPSGVITIKEPK